jgi:hypothetical protein
VKTNLRQEMKESEFGRDLSTGFELATAGIVALGEKWAEQYQAVREAEKLRRDAAKKKAKRAKAKAARKARKKNR